MEKLLDRLEKWGFKHYLRAPGKVTDYRYVTAVGGGMSDCGVPK